MIKPDSYEHIVLNTGRTRGLSEKQNANPAETLLASVSSGWPMVLAGRPGSRRMGRF